MRFNFFFWQSQSITCNSKEDVGKVRSETNIIKGMDEIRKKKNISFAKFKLYRNSKTTQFIFIEFPKKIATNNG